MDIKQVRALVELMKQNDLTELRIRDGESMIRLRRGQEGQIIAAPAMQAVSPIPATVPVAAAQAAASQPEPPKTPELPTIDSPMVGTFYTAADPESEPCVKLGDRVGPDTVVCIIEAMKVFNEIKAETSGTIEKILLQNQAPVEFGQPMFLIRPD